MTTSPALPSTTERQPIKSQPLPPGTEAPDFTLSGSGPTPRITLSDLRGRPVVLAFYPSDWSPVCTDQLSIYQEILPEFERHDAIVIGLSVDSVWCHMAWANDRHISFPLLSDFEPKGEVARQYSAYRLPEGTSERALYVIDRKGVIHWSYISPISVNPGADGILNALEDLARKEQSS